MGCWTGTMKCCGSGTPRDPAESREHGPRGSAEAVPRVPASTLYRPAMVENPNPLAGNTVGARFRVGPGNGSSTTGRIPANASSLASISPFGPAPAMTTSFI